MGKYETKDSWKHKEFSTGMMRDTSEQKPRFDLLHPIGLPYEEQMLTRFANLLGRWAIKYAERNREKAETVEELNRFKESASRHFEQWLCWEQDEDHWAAVWFNIMGAEYVKFRLSQKANDSIN